MQDVFVVSAKRSAIAKAFRGSLRTKRPDDLCADLIKACLKATKEFDYSLIDDVIIGCAMPEAEQGMNVARFSLLLAGLPESVPGVTINRFCSSGLQSIAMAAERIRAGWADCILAGGTESMTAVPMMGHKVVGSRNVMDHHPEYYLGMGLTAENVAKEYNISREDQDQFAFESHQKAVTALEKGYFHEEIVPVTYERRHLGREGHARIVHETFDRDEGPRPDTTIKALGALRPAFLHGGSVTAGNSSQMSDGASICLVVSEDFLKKHNLEPQARICSYAVAGVPPRVMGIGPVEAIPKALRMANVKLEDIDHIELNEAFAAQALAVIRTCGIDPDKVNPYGGAIALGHPLGATGAKLTATLLSSLKRKNQKYGIVTMCIGTGMGAAAVFQAV